MPALYFASVALLLVAVAVTGMLWTIIVLRPQSRLAAHMRDVRAVHFGSLYLAPLLLGLAWAFERLQVPPRHWLPLPIGLAGIVVFSGIGWLFPKLPQSDPFYYWTRGPALALTLVGMALLVAGLGWTAVVLVVYGCPTALP